MLAAEGKKDEAIPEIQAALKLSPNDVEAQRDLADLQTQSANLPDAEKTYRDLVKASPNDAELHHSLGEILLKQRQFPEAEQEFMAAIKLKPDFGDAYWHLAVAADENKNYPLAIKALDVRDKLLPPTALGYFMRATAYDHLHDFKQASVYYRLFLDAAKGEYPDQEWQARHRLIAIPSQEALNHMRSSVMHACSPLPGIASDHLLQVLRPKRVAAGSPSHIRSPNFSFATQTFYKDGDTEHARAALGHRHQFPASSRQWKRKTLKNIGDQ